jgi:carbamoyltransferase
MIIIGINAYHGDSSACILKDGVLLAAVEEERFNRKKHWAGLPIESIKYCLKNLGITLAEVDYIAVNRNSFSAIKRQFKYIIYNPLSHQLIWNRFKNKLMVSDILEDISNNLDCNNNVKTKIFFVEHHLAHLSSSFFVSPFENSAIVSVDGFGDFTSVMYGYGSNNQIKSYTTIDFPHSLGIFYSAITQFLGFNKYGDEYKVMGLAPYGKPVYMDEMLKLISLKSYGKFELNLKYFLHHLGKVRITWNGCEPNISQIWAEDFFKIFGMNRNLNEPIIQKHKDIAASAQLMYEKSLFHILNFAFDKTKSINLCLAGGCAMNSVANGKIIKNTSFKNIYIPPAPGDSGGAIGAAFYIWNQIKQNPRLTIMNHAYYGPEYSESEMMEAIQEIKINKENEINIFKYDDFQKIADFVAKSISKGCVIGWFQDRMEWGPRALGNRSILGDPRRLDMKDILNKKIKRRESFRPFAPSILKEEVAEWFDTNMEEPFMLQVHQVKNGKQKIIPSVTHIDGSGRLQTVDKKTNLKYYKLIKAFENITGVPILLNTSFNENEPIVCNPKEAIDCFMRTKMDMLVMGNFILERSKLN